MEPKQPLDPEHRRPLSDRDPTGDPTRCGHFGHRRKGDGKLCVGPVVVGTTSCRMHGGVPVEQLRARGAVVVEASRWGLGTATVDPGVVLLRLVTQSAARVELYSRLLEEAYAAAGRLQDGIAAQEITLVEPETRLSWHGEHPVALPEHASRQTAREDLRRIFLQGPVAALIGHTYTSTKDGDVFATGEAIRSLAKLEAEERDRCANFAAKAVAAGLAERMVRQAEHRGVEMAGVVRRVLSALDLSADQWARVPDLLRQAVSAITGKIIEGEVTV